MNFWMYNFLEDLIEALKEVDVLTINDEEARQLSAEHSLVNAAKKILKMGPKYLIIKKGEHGALLFGDIDQKEIFFTPALPLENVLDPTGAGDSFAGGFVGYLDKTKDLSFENMKKAVVYGSILASFSVETFGTENLENLTKDKINCREKDFIKLTSL